MSKSRWWPGLFYFTSKQSFVNEISNKGKRVKHCIVIYKLFKKFFQLKIFMYLKSPPKNNTIYVCRKILWNAIFYQYVQKAIRDETNLIEFCEFIVCGVSWLFWTKQDNILSGYYILFRILTSLQMVLCENKFLINPSTRKNIIIIHVFKSILTITNPYIQHAEGYNKIKCCYHQHKIMVWHRIFGPPAYICKIARCKWG